MVTRALALTLSNPRIGGSLRSSIHIPTRMMCIASWAHAVSASDLPVCVVRGSWGRASFASLGPGEFCISLRRVFADHLIISRKQKPRARFCPEFSPFLAHFFAELTDELSRQ